MPTTEIPTEVYIDGSGPVHNAVVGLVVGSTLNSHVTITTRSPGDSVLRVAHAPGNAVPYDHWGSATQGLWLLLLSFAGRGHQVALYDVVGRLDQRNLRAVATAMAAYCGLERSIV